MIDWLIDGYQICMRDKPEIGARFLDLIYGAGFCQVCHVPKEHAYISCVASDSIGRSSSAEWVWHARSRKYAISWTAAAAAAFADNYNWVRPEK